MANTVHSGAKGGTTNARERLSPECDKVQRGFDYEDEDEDEEDGQGQWLLLAQARFWGILDSGGL
jgi:hypothetical protein